MSFFSSSDNGEKVSLLIDIGNSEVSCALAVFNSDNLPRFVYSSSSSFDVTEKVDSSRLVDSLVSILENEMAKILKDGFKNKYWAGKANKISGALVSFSSPWFVLKTKHINISNEKDFIVSKAFIDDVFLKEEQIFKTELSPGSPDQHIVFEKSMVHTKINGYELGNIINKRTKMLEASICFSAMDSSLSDKVINIVNKYTHIPKDSYSFHSFPLISFTVVRDYFTAGNDFLIMDVSGDVTDITLVQNSVITQTVSVPSGRNYILRQISKNFDVSLEIAESMFHMFIEDKSDETINEKIHELLGLIEPEWAIYIENALQELSPSINLPSNVYLMANSDVAHIYSEFIKLPKTDLTSNFRKSLNLNILDENSVKKFFENESGVGVNEFIVFGSLFYKKIYLKK